MKVGDMVLKCGDYDKSLLGLVLEIKTNSVGHSFVKVMRHDGTVAYWHIKYVKRLN